MATPLKKTKANEVILILQSLSIGQTLTEFKYARGKKLLAECKEQTPMELWLMLNSLIELNYNNLKLAHDFALQNLHNSKNLTSLRNAHYVFNHTLDYESASKSIELIIELLEAQKLNFSNIPDNFVPEFYLSGRLDKLLKKKDLLGNMNTIQEFIEISDLLEISSDKLNEIMCIIHNVSMENNARCWAFDYSVIQGEFLMSACIDAPYEKIVELNHLVFDRCYEHGLVDELNKLAFGFLPFNGEEESE